MKKRLDPDIYQRAAWPLKPRQSRRRLEDTVVFGAMIVVALGFVLASKLALPVTVSLRTGVQDAAAVILSAATRTVAPVIAVVLNIAGWRTAVAERDRLRAENDMLKAWQARAQMLEHDVAALAKLAHVVADQRFEYVTARVISGNGGPFTRVTLLDAGRDQGVKAGFPAMSAQGLVGRVVASGQTSARLLLLSDFNSRIPVMIGDTAVRAVMQGDNSPLPKIAYLPPGSAIQPGDPVFTSGIGGLFPRGLRVGKVVDTGDALRIEPSAPMDRLDFVSVVMFDTMTAVITHDEAAVEARAALPPRFSVTLPSDVVGGSRR